MPANPKTVTVIPADHLIMVDGEALTFDFASQLSVGAAAATVPWASPALVDLHALHWDGSAVAVERISPSGIMDNARYGAAAYETWAAPFVALWQAEKDRREAEANTPPPPPLPPTEDEKTGHLATVRWQAEIGGTTWGNHTVETDREAQGKYTSELTAVLTGVRVDPSPWKLGGQFVLLSNAEFQAVAIAARAHVMACFAAEAAVQSTLADLPTLDAVATAFTAALAQVKEG